MQANSINIRLAHGLPEIQMIFLGLEGSANKLGVALVDKEGSIIQNIRETFVTPAGTGFQPRATAKHHREHVVRLIQKCLANSGISLSSLEAICYTKGTACC